jgi:pyruvate dehydrogenase E2 component (dihydrolipoamide acetyltransferase)
MGNASPDASVPEPKEVRQVPHTMTRRTIARRLTESKQQVPHFYVKGACRIDALIALRKQINTPQMPVSLNDLIIKAVALALVKVPDANVSWGDAAMDQHGQVDVSVAVATPRGLVTPILRRADTRPVAELAQEARALAARGREGKLKSSEYVGGTVSVSNLGMFDVDEFSAILNPPQSCIFAIGTGRQVPVVEQGALAIATVMNVVMSVDHRAVDGAVAAQLMSAFRKLIEQPEALIG